MSSIEASAQTFANFMINSLIEFYDKFTDIRQQHKYLLEYLAYMFRPVNRSSSGHQYSESEVLLDTGIPIFSIVNYILYCLQL